MADNMSIRPTMPGNGAPYPFNDNDVFVWKSIISKHICKNHIEIFKKEEFYAALLRKELGGDAYVEPLSKATEEQRKLFDNLLYYSLDSLSKNNLLKKSSNTEYRRTPRMNIFCPDIMKYDIVDVDAIVEPVQRAKEEIQQDANPSAVVAMLKDISGAKLIHISSSNDKSTINKLNQLGTIFLTLNGDIKVSPIGRKVVSDIDTASQNTKM